MLYSSDQRIIQFNQPLLPRTDFLSFSSYYLTRSTSSVGCRLHWRIPSVASCSVFGTIRWLFYTTYYLIGPRYNVQSWHLWVSIFIYRWRMYAMTIFIKVNSSLLCQFVLLQRRTFCPVWNWTILQIDLLTAMLAASPDLHEGKLGLPINWTTAVLLCVNRLTVWNDHRNIS